MANSKYEYVKGFEEHSRLLPQTYTVVRVDGKGFHGFTRDHGYAKPNDTRGLLLMARAARAVIEQYNDIALAYGQSDEFSFLIARDSLLYNRRVRWLRIPLSLSLSIYLSLYLSLSLISLWFSIYY